MAKSKGREVGYKNLIPAKKGDKIAEKWTEQTVMPILNAMWADLTTDDSGLENKNIVRANDIKLIGEIRLMHGVTKQQWSEWKAKFKKNDLITDLISKIDDLLECRLIYSDSRMDEFVLKNKYGYVDKIVQEQDVTANVTATNKTETTVKLDNLSQSTIKELIKARGGK